MYYDTCIEISDDEIIDYVNINYLPSEVFSDEALTNWALDNGLVSR